MKRNTYLAGINTQVVINGIAKVLVSGAVLLTVSCAGNPGSGNALANGDGPELECINLKLTGTNIPKRYCRTKGEWEALSSNDRDIAKEYMRQTSERSGIMEQEVGGSPYDRGQ